MKEGRQFAMRTGLYFKTKGAICNQLALPQLRAIFRPLNVVFFHDFLEDEAQDCSWSGLQLRFARAHGQSEGITHKRPRVRERERDTGGLMSVRKRQRETQCG